METQQFGHKLGYVKVKVTQLCPTLPDPTDYTVHEILQARILEWVALPFSRGLPNPGIEPRSPTLQAESLPAEPPGKPPVGMATHSSILAWRIPWTPGVTKSQTQLSDFHFLPVMCAKCLLCSQDGNIVPHRQRQFTTNASSFPFSVC